MTDCRWKSLENDCYICRCGYSEFVGQEVDEFMCEFCEDYHSVIDTENERKVDNDTVEML